MIHYATQIDFPAANYKKGEYEKIQIILHFTAGKTATGAIEHWKTRLGGKGTVSTPFIIANGSEPSKYKDGEIIQLYDEKYYAFALGQTCQTLGGLSSTTLMMKSINIEIVNWGPLIQWSPNKFSPIDYENVLIPSKNIVSFSTPHRGIKDYEKYTDKQITSLARLLGTLCDEYKIPKKYQGFDHVFRISEHAISGSKGIFSHVSYNPNKYDCHPQQELIYMLNNIP